MKQHYYSSGIEFLSIQLIYVLLSHLTFLCLLSVKPFLCKQNEWMNSWTAEQ